MRLRSQRALRDVLEHRRERCRAIERTHRRIVKKFSRTFFSKMSAQVAAEYMASGSTCYFEISTLVRELTFRRARQSWWI